MRGEMLTETADALGEQGNLDFRRSGVIGFTAELRDHSAFFLCAERHSEKPFKYLVVTTLLKAAHSTR
jgi:hypothetical protein